MAYTLGGQSVWYGYEKLVGCSAGLSRTGAKGAEVHGVDLENVQDPGLRPRTRFGVQGERGAQARLVICSDPPYDQAVVAAMPRSTYSAASPSRSTQSARPLPGKRHGLSVVFMLRKTYVMILSGPQGAMPSMAFVCARHTARGRMMVRSQSVT
jgi:hypothetical protein